MAEVRPLDSLVRALYDMRLALVALAVVVEVAASGSAWTVSALLVALPVSYIPLRRWSSMGHRLATLRPWLLIDALGAAALTVIVQDPQIMLLYSVATAMLAGLVGGRLGAALVTGVLVGFLGLALVLSAMAGVVTPSTVAVSSVFAALYVLFGAGSLRLTRLMRDYDIAVDTARAASRQAAQAEERSRLAREMHDNLSKTVQGTHLMAIAVSKRLADQGAEPRLQQDAERLVTACDIATRDARRLLNGLREDDRPRATASVSRQVEQVVLEWQTRTAVPARVRAALPDGEDDLPTELVYEVCCIVGEALDNAHRHGGAGDVEVRLVPRDGWLEVTVTDDGAGFAVPADLSALHRAGHYGLIGMWERAQRVGGRLSVRSGVAAGTTVTVSLPAPAVQAVEQVGS